MFDRSYFDPRTTHGRWTLIGIAAVVLAGLAAGFFKVAAIAVWYAIFFALVGALITALEGALASLLKSPRGLVAYRRGVTQRFLWALGIALVHMLWVVFWPAFLAAVVLVAVKTLAVMVGFILGQSLWSGRKEVMKTAKDLQEGKTDIGTVARSAADKVRESAEKGIGQTVQEVQRRTGA